MKSRWFSPIALLGLALVAAPLPAARTLDDAPVKVTSVEGITEYRLANGLRVLLFPDASTPRVTVNLTYMVGSRHEGYGETGMAHLLEHMLFKGTPQHPAIPKALQERGAQFNATTSYDRTNYFETLPATGDNLEFALRLEADRMINSFVRRDDLASEMTVVRNEFEAGENQPSSILRQRIWAVAFEWHNYGKTVIGNRSDIERVPIENLQAFYRRFYQPDNAVLVIAGSFDEAQALALVTKYFGSIPKPTRKLDNTYTEEPTQDGERSVVLRRVGDVAVVGVVYRIPAGPHPDFVALQILANVLGSEPSGKLYRGLVETKRATSVAAFALPLHDPGLIQMVAEAAPGTPLEQLRDKLLNLIQNSADTITDEDVERARRELLRVREMAATDASRVALQLSEWAAQGDWRLYFRHRDLLEQVKLADVQRVAQTYLKTDNRTVGLFIPTPQPDRAALPATPDVAKLVDGYTGRTKLAAGETFDPTPANIDARTQRSTLPGGIKVAAFPKKTRGETVNIILTLRYGDEERLKPFLGASDFLGSMLVRGTQKLDYAQLKEELTKAAATVTVNHSPGSLTFSVLTKREHLPRALELLHQIVREPAFPAKEFEVLKAEALNRLEKGRTDPASQAQLLMQRTLFPYAKDNLRYIPTLDESIERVQETTLEQVQALYRDLIGASAGELIVVGDCDADQVVQTVQAMLSGWPTPQGYTRVTRPAIPTEKGQTLTIHTPDKANATFIAGFQFALRDDDPDYPALVMANYIVGGGGTLSSRLGDRIRQKDGLSYGVGSVVNADALDGRCVFIIFAICAPQNLGKVDAAVKEELERFLKEGVTAEELDKAKQAYLQAQKVARSQDRVLPRLLAENTYVGRTMAYQADLEEKIAGLTPEQVVAAFRKHVDTNRLIIIHAGDQEKK